jgi:hypothetical protein
MSPNNSSQSAGADEKDRDKDSRWTLHRRKTNRYRGLQASMFDTDHQITTFCVLTQHSTVQWHTVPSLHTTPIFCSTELHPCIYCSHSPKTTVKDKAVPLYTMKTSPQAQLQLHSSVTSAENTDKWSAASMLGKDPQHPLNSRPDVPRAGLMFWIESKSHASANKQTTYGPASRLSLYWLRCHWQ